ncbi:MAG TPA: hypothetical protein VI298_09560 [Geobacteraceae bacterium]
MSRWHRRWLPFAVAVVAAVVAAASVNEHAFYNLRFHLGLYSRDARKAEIEQTLRQFNRDFATFFNVGGPTSILPTFPADNLIKRRIFQEVRYWDGMNAVMVYDKDTFTIEKIELTRPDRAVVIAREVWYISAQDAVTRKTISTLKKSPERVRYILRLDHGKWRVMEFEIYGEKDAIPAEVKG